MLKKYILILNFLSLACILKSVSKKPIISRINIFWGWNFYHTISPKLQTLILFTDNQYLPVVYTTQVNSTFCMPWLASSEVIRQVLFTSEQPKKNKMTFVGILSQIKLLFRLLVIQLVWYILKQLLTSVSVKVVYIYLHFGE